MSIIFSPGHRQNRSQFASPHPQRAYEAVINRLSSNRLSQASPSGRRLPCPPFCNRYRVSDRTLTEARDLTRNGNLPVEQRRLGLWVIYLAGELE